MLLSLIVSMGVGMGDPVGVADITTAQELVAQRRSPEALTVIEALQQQAPTSELALLRVRALLVQGENQQARLGLVQIGEQYKKEVAVHLDRADIYAELGDVQSAFTVLQILKGRWPENASIAERVGDAYARLATAAYLDALRLDPDDQQARLKFSGLAATGRVSDLSNGRASLPTGQELRSAIAEITEALKIWADAWSASNSMGYAAAYAPPVPIELEQPNGSRRLLSEIAVVFTSPNRARADFVELQRSQEGERKRYKRVNLARGNDRRWRLSNERVLVP